MDENRAINWDLLKYGSTRGKLLERSFPLTPFQELLGKGLLGVTFAHPKGFLYPHGAPAPFIPWIAKNIALQCFFKRGLTGGEAPCQP